MLLFPKDSVGLNVVEGVFGWLGCFGGFSVFGFWFGSAAARQNTCADSDFSAAGGLSDLLFSQSFELF